MIPAKQIKVWLKTLKPNAFVAIDDGGLCLVEVMRDRNKQDDAPYIELGGVPLDPDIEDWRKVVANGDTELGFEEWKAKWWEHRISPVK